VQQAESQISAHMSSALGFGKVAAALCAQFPVFTDVLLGCLHEESPFVPPPRFTFSLPSPPHR
jgi:hypothetical protein